MTGIANAVEMANAIGMPVQASEASSLVEAISRAWKVGARDGGNLAIQQAAQVCQEWIDDHCKADNCTYNDCDMVAAVTDVRAAILQLKTPSGGLT